jgi:hypothetical protein
MAIEFLHETTKSWNADYRVPCHTYLIENSRTVGYVKEGTSEIIMFKKPKSFSKSRRTFTKLSKETVQRLVYPE